MTVLPETTLRRIEFCEAHVPQWGLSPASVGLTPAQVASLAARTAAARVALREAEMAREASLAATLRLHAAAAAMSEDAATLIRQIKAFAELQANTDAVYVAAQIPVPAARLPLAPPGVPTDLRVALNSDGSVTLSWKAKGSTASTGAFFVVSRKVLGQRSFVAVGGTPGTTNFARRASFTDTTLPASAAGVGVEYTVQGFRGDRAGEVSGAITVQFGVGSGEGASVVGVRATPMRVGAAA